MLTALHVLLTYRCTMACEHCFLYCGPAARGTFTLAQI
jgi:MoaA/NifB/PqqE/SkfB family radical SAM enzyme